MRGIGRNHASDRWSTSPTKVPKIGAQDTRVAGSSWAECGSGSTGFRVTMIPKIPEQGVGLRGELGGVRSKGQGVRRKGVPMIPAQGVERSVASEITASKILAQGGTWLRVPAPRVREASRCTQSPG